MRLSFPQTHYWYEVGILKVTEVGSYWFTGIVALMDRHSPRYSKVINVNIISSRRIPWSKSDTAGYLLYYSVKRTQLIGRRPLSPCRVRKTAGYTLPRLFFPRIVPRFSETYPDMAGSGTLPSAILSARIPFRSQQRTPKPKSSCSKHNGSRHCLFRRAVRSYQKTPKHQLFL